MNNDVRARIRAEMQAVFPTSVPSVAPFYAMQEYHLGCRKSLLSSISSWMSEKS